ncbi:MAG: hypothetical protein M1818_002023 [Claussenomyces sp. TS43310]|nr:MAG: hypothetical protein M1818_002023 [Claussenomyces sp. TS43310]
MHTRASAAQEASFLAKDADLTEQGSKTLAPNSRNSKLLASTTREKVSIGATGSKSTPKRAVGGRNSTKANAALKKEANRSSLVSVGDSSGSFTATTTPEPTKLDDVNVNHTSNSKEMTSLSPESSHRKRKRAAPRRNKNVNNGELVQGGWDELPHNMGNTGTVQSGDIETNSGVKTLDVADQKLGKSNKPRVSRRNGKSARVNAAVSQTLDHVAEDSKADLQQELENETEHASRKGRNSKKAAQGRVYANLSEGLPKRKRAAKLRKLDKSEDVKVKFDDLLTATEKPDKRPKKGKLNPYGLSPGETPFPDFPMPTIAACNEVNHLLSKLHGSVEAPKEIPAPSLEFSGCGEVPSVLDALIRTRLSAATSGQNSRYAFQGLVEKYGIYEDGIGKGSVNWNKVRDSSEADIAEAIKRGGLAVTKSKSIKAILNMVHEQNLARSNAFIKEKEYGQKVDMVGTEKQTQGQKDMEIAVADQNILSLQYMHGLTSEEAMTELVKFPGIGVKTASCVILFCLQQPSFAVDTHVWRLCKWLRWVPEGATRDQTFSHCEVRVPDDMKYSLHQLFIKHGKTCGRCRAITGEASEVWADTNCPIEKLVLRTGARKGGMGFRPLKKTAAEKARKAKAKKSDNWDSDLSMADEESEAQEGSEVSGHDPDDATEDEND